MTKIKVLACDARSCEVTGRDVKSYSVNYPDGVLNVDLCTTHSEPLRELRAALPNNAFTKLRPGGRSRMATGFRKQSMEDIEREMSERDTPNG